MRFQRLRAAGGVQKQAGPFGGTAERPSVARAAAESRGAGPPGRYNKYGENYEARQHKSASNLNFNTYLYAAKETLK